MQNCIGTFSFILWHYYQKLEDRKKEDGEADDDDDDDNDELDEETLVSDRTHCLSIFIPAGKEKET